MPAVQPSSAHFGEVSPDLLGHAIPIGGVAGDQQSALFGQACFKAGMAKNTYGTGCFMLMHTGDQFQTSHNGLITSAAAQPSSTPAYVFEGSVFVGGAVVQWLRDGLQRHQGQRRSADPGRKRARFRRRDDGAGLHRPGRALLEPRRARHHHGPDARQHGGPHCAGGAGEHCLSKRRPAASHEP